MRWPTKLQTSLFFIPLTIQPVPLSLYHQFNKNPQNSFYFILFYLFIFSIPSFFCILYISTSPNLLSPNLLTSRSLVSPPKHARNLRGGFSLYLSILFYPVSAAMSQVIFTVISRFLIFSVLHRIIQSPILLLLLFFISLFVLIFSFTVELAV